MIKVRRYSEPYSPTGSLAAEGVINQLGRPDIEALEVLLREAIQNCWDARRPAEHGIRVEIGRRHLAAPEVRSVRKELLVDPPPSLPLAEHLTAGMQIMYFADFGTSGLGGPTRADLPGGERDFIDFIRNIGQPPDRDLGGGSFGYGKAAFYLASKARTVLVDTLCSSAEGKLERRFIACALGDSYDEQGRPHTGRHWWGLLVKGVPEPLIGADAEEAARLVGLPARKGRGGRGTTIAIVAPETMANPDEGTDPTMGFVAEALTWNFWPRMIDTPGGVRRTMEFRVTDNDKKIRVPDPRTHPRLRGFVEAMDRLQEEPQGEDDFTLDRSVECLRPIRTLGRLVIQKGSVAPLAFPHDAMPQGARQMGDSVHHVALMRNVELVVKYLPGPAPVTGRIGYAGVFRCALDVDAAFRSSEPPTHDDWVYRAVPPGHQRTFVKVALERVAEACREAAGYQGSTAAAAAGDGIPLGEFADALAVLMPGLDGPGARRRAVGERKARRPRSAPGRSTVGDAASDVWTEGVAGVTTADPGGASATVGDGDSSSAVNPGAPTPPVTLPQARPGGDPRPAIASDGSPVVRYPFELRARGNRLRLSGTIEVMTNDGAQVESEPPSGYTPPAIRAWTDPSGVEHLGPVLLVDPEGADGLWLVEVPIQDEAMMRVDVTPEIG